MFDWSGTGNELACIFAAFILDCLIGDPQWLPHPVRLIGFYIACFEKTIRRIVKTNAALRAAGMMLTLTTVAGAYGLTWVVLRWAAEIHIWVYYAVYTLLAYTCLAARCLAHEGKRIYTALLGGDITQARKLLSYIVGRDTGELDESGITRGAVETVAENTSDGVVAPLLYLFIGGVPLAMAYKAVNTLDSMVGYKNERFLYFGWASAKLDDLANYVPARLTGILMVAAAWLLRLDAKQSLKILRRDSRNHSSPNSGFPEAAAAGALGVQLGGMNNYFGKPVVKPTIGNSSRPLDKQDIVNMNRLMYTAVIITIVAFSLLKIGLERLI